MTLSRRTRSLDDEGHRKTIHPIEVNGKWKKRKQALHFALIVFFLALPWISIGGKPLLLLNIVERKFSVFGILFRAHDVPLIFLFFVSFILFFGLLTTLFGRVWCGWACPQTVFIESVFRRIEGWIEGNAFERKKNDELPMTFERWVKRAIKWGVFILISMIITHSALAVFVGPVALKEMIRQGPAESPQAFLFIVISTLIILLDFGWFREQFCIVVCPYGRIQSVFQDEKTKTVTYDVQRGEPRGNIRSQASSQSGDCVDCMRCVQVCPTGIDIREGSSQLECIACTACMDACDDVMTRLRRKPKLIGYASIEKSAKLLSGRVLVYFLLLIALMIGIILIASSRTIVMVEVFKNRGVPFSESGNSGSKDKWISNLFIVEIGNRSQRSLLVSFRIPENAKHDLQLVMPNNPILLESGIFLRQPMTVQFKAADLRAGKSKTTLQIEVRENGSNQITEAQMKELTLVGPLTIF